MPQLAEVICYSLNLAHWLSTTLSPNESYSLPEPPRRWGCSPERIWLTHQQDEAEGVVSGRGYKMQLFNLHKGSSDQLCQNTAPARSMTQLNSYVEPDWASSISETKTMELVTPSWHQSAKSAYSHHTRKTARLPDRSSIRWLRMKQERS